MIIVEFCDYYKFILKLKGERISLEIVYDGK